MDVLPIITNVGTSGMSVEDKITLSSCSFCVYKPCECMKRKATVSLSINRRVILNLERVRSFQNPLKCKIHSGVVEMFTWICLFASQIG